MPRQGRLDAPGALHHVIARGVGRGLIFSDEADRKAFLKYLGPVLLATRTECFAWCLMPNHFHLLLRTGFNSLGKVMQRVLTRYALYHNQRHRRPGHLFQNRYKAILCEDEPYFLDLVRYIHLNPVKARLVDSLNALAQYPWTGHQAILGIRPMDWQNTGEVLERFGKVPAMARKSYLEFMRSDASGSESDILEGGGLIRSLGGWTAALRARRMHAPVQADERILGTGDFVAAALRAMDEGDRRRTWKGGRPTPMEVVERAAAIVGVRMQEIQGCTRRPQAVKARQLACKWLVEDLRLPGVAVVKLLKVSKSAVSRAAIKGVGVERELGARLE